MKSITKKTTTRDSNIELLRIVLMIMIIMIHYLVRGYKLPLMGNNNYVPTENTPYYLFTFTFVIIAVNCYFFISGFYSIKPKINNLISFIIQALFFSIISFLIAHFIFPNRNILHANIIETLFPISYNHWWFLNIYLALYVFSPIINAGISILNKNQILLIIIILIYLQTSYIFTGLNYLSTTGHSMYSMLLMYLLGRYCNINKIKIKHPGFLFIGFIIILFCIFYFLGIIKGSQSIAWRLLTYNSIFNIIGSILFFYMFKNLTIKNIPFLNKCAALSFGVYLFHESESLKIVVGKIPLYLSHHIHSGIGTIIILLLAAIFMFIIGIIIEKIRLLVSRPIIDYIVKFSNKLNIYI
jgi:surface polysaccharide O-acyltransferase-like enzyme